MSHDERFNDMPGRAMKHWQAISTAAVDEDMKRYRAFENYEQILLPFFVLIVTAHRKTMTRVSGNDAVHINEDYLFSYSEKILSAKSIQIAH